MKKRVRWKRSNQYKQLWRVVFVYFFSLFEANVIIKAPQHNVHHWQLAIEILFVLSKLIRIEKEIETPKKKHLPKTNCSTRTSFENCTLTVWNDFDRNARSIEIIFLIINVKRTTNYQQFLRCICAERPNRQTLMKMVNKSYEAKIALRWALQS